MEKLKNWLIKKLGGYTTADMLAQSAYRPVQFKTEEKRIETIKAKYRIPPDFGQFVYGTPDEMAKGEILHRLMMKVQECGAIKFEDTARMEEVEGPEWHREIIGTIQVVVPQEVGK